MPPTLLIEALEGLRRRVRVFSIAYGVGLVLAATIAGLLAFVLIDFILQLGRAPRGVLLLAGFVALGYAIVRWVVRPAQAKLSINDIAGRVENVYPQFEDRLRSTVDFIRSGGASVPGSEPMKLATIAEASKRAEGIDFDRVVNPAPAWYSVGAAAGALVIVFALGFLLPRVYVTTALSRLGLGTTQWPKTVEIALLKDVPTRVPVGQRVDVQMRLTKGDKDSRKAVIYYRYDDKSAWQQEVMKRGADGVYTSSIDARLDASKNVGNLQIKMSAGDDTKELSPISIVPRLDISRIVANITAPAYAGSAKASVNLAERAAVMPVGAGVELRVEFNKPLDASHHVSLVPAEPNLKAPEVKWDLSGGSIASGTFEASQSIRFSIGARDQDGFENTAAQQYELIVREDGMPTVQIEEPRRSEDRTANAAFPLQAVAEDDYGISTAQLVVTRVGQAPTAGAAASAGTTQPAPAPNAQTVNKWIIPLVENASPVSNVSWEPAGASGDRKRYRLDYTWDLGKLANANLKPGDVLEYFVQVKDNFKLKNREHDFVPSGKLRITIISAEQWQKLVQAEVEQIGNEIRQIKQGQARTKVETGELAKNAAERGKFDEADKTAAERLANQQGTTASQTMQSGQKLENLVKRMNENKSPEGGVKQTAKEVAERLSQLADGEMREAGKSIDDAKDKKALDPKAKPDEQKKDANDRAADLNKATEQQNVSEQKLQAAMDKLGDFSTLGDMIARIQDLADQQKKIGNDFNKNAKDNLGKKPEELSKDARDKNDQLAKEQDTLQQKTQKALADMDKKADDMKKSDAAKSQAMKDAAKSGSSVPQQQQQNSQSMQQNQQAQAQQAQKQIELGLEMVLQKLKEAERRELEQLQKQLAELEQLLTDLIKRQAGHNIDNLTVDNPKKLAEMTKDARDELMQLAGRDEKNQPAPPAQNELSPAQETTERNTRDVSKKAEELPNPAPATKLTAAAGQMERAIVNLRAAKLADAYDPPQVEALKALEEALEMVRKDRTEADKKLEEKDKETIRQQYVKLLEDQKKLDADTKAIEAKRDKDGNLPRAIAVQLNALPGVQGGLHERAAKLGEDLQKLKSIVYDWANREMARSMEDVKEQLGNRETGDVTQTNQKKIEEQIAAMIDNLKETPPKPEKFASRNQGGGGGQQGKPPPPRMPTEAELRLLKAFQNGVKVDTTAIDANAKGKKPDAKETLALGGRQGELRNLLDEMIKQATQGKVSLGPEPDNKDQLPEEAKEGDVENQELDQELLGNGKDEPEADAVVDKIKKTGQRMARSRQRLALNNDPGKVTQIIQKRIALDLDELIKEAQRQQQQGQASGKQRGKPSQQKSAQANAQNAQQKPKPGNPQASQSKAPAQSDPKSLQGAPPDQDLSKEIREKSEEWGKLFDRRREAVIEGGGQQVIRKYRQFVDDYYRSLSEKARDQR